MNNENNIFENNENIGFESGEANTPVSEPDVFNEQETVFEAEQATDAAEPEITEAVFAPIKTEAQSSPYEAVSPYQNPNQSPYTSPAPPTSGNKSGKGGHKALFITLWVLVGVFGVSLVSICAFALGALVSNGSSVYDYFLNPSTPSATQPETEPSDDGKDDSGSFWDDFFGGDDKTPEETEPSDDKNAVESPDDADIYSQDGNVTLNKYPADKEDTSKYNTQSAYKKVSPSTVGIVCYEGNDDENIVSQGTGIVITKDGYIATNSHVIGDSKTAYNIQVVLSDSKIYEAKVVGFDTRTDLAVIKISADNLTPAEFVDSDLVTIGEDVIAIGNPGGIEFQNSITRGIVSAKDRALDLSTQVDYIQTDAAINPGNSGGPLCNLQGQVIGINSAKIASSEFEGMGFAIPSRTVKQVVDDLIKQGYVSGRVKIGISGTPVTKEEAQANNVPRGILVAEIVKDGPCYHTKIKANDIITALDGKEVTSFEQIYKILTEYSAGDEITLSVYRIESAETFDVKIILQEDKGQ